MIVIYTQEKTYIASSAFSAKPILITVYGEKLGKEAYETMKNAREGAIYQKYGGPLVRMVSSEEADIIRKKEALIGMIEE